MCKSGRGPGFIGATSPVSSNFLYILCAVPRPICSRVAISQDESPIPARCQTTLQPMSDEYAAVRAGSADVLLSAMFTNLCGYCSKSAGGRRGVTTPRSHAGMHVPSETKLTVVQGKLALPGSSQCS